MACAKSPFDCRSAFVACSTETPACEATSFASSSEPPPTPSSDLVDGLSLNCDGGDFGVVNNDSPGRGLHDYFCDVV